MVYGRYSVFMDGKIFNSDLEYRKKILRLPKAVVNLEMTLLACCYMTMTLHVLYCTVSMHVSHQLKVAFVNFTHYWVAFGDRLSFHKTFCYTCIH